MKRLAIVSSYSESCGNAAFTRVLKSSIEQHAGIEVEVIELDLKLLQSIEPRVRRSASAHIDDLCRQLGKFDAVNIQLEAGLYGTLPGDIVSRCRRLMQANPRTSVTMHSPRLISNASSDIRAGIKKLFKLELASGLRQILHSLLGDTHVRINHRLVRAAVAERVRLIVHTLRAQEQILAFYGYSNVLAHPLKIAHPDFQPDTSVLANIVEGLPDWPDAASTASPARQPQAGGSPPLAPVFVGMFGYISAYKGHWDALQALTHLPRHFKLLVFGRQHPQTIKTDGSVDPYIALLRNTVSQDKRLKGRVFFLGELPDDDFMNVAATVDMAWLPYYENGQDGSGIASICLDVNPRVLCSASFAFDELFRLITYRNVLRFDIGNHLEMATKTTMLLRRSPPVKPYAEASRFNLVTQAHAYTSLLSGQGDPVGPNR